VLRLENISVRLGGFQLRRVSLDVSNGEYVVLLGSTGTGKTVLLETIAGLHKPHEGKIFLNSRNATRLPPESRKLGVVYQDYALFPHLTVYGNISFGLRLSAKGSSAIGEQVKEMARFLEIDHLLERRPLNLSGGERQRVALARALVLKPHLLLLDEPLSALDRLTRERLKRELRRIHREIGVAILHITHDLSEAFYLADRLVVMREGAVLQEGRPEEVLERPAGRFVAELLGIQNFIPASLGKTGELTLNGTNTGRKAAFAGLAPDGPDRFLLTVPGSSLELFPDRAPDLYLWKGVMRIGAVTPTDGDVELELGARTGNRLRTSLSRRELARLPAALEQGAEVPVGVLKEGVYWVREEEQ